MPIALFQLSSSLPVHSLMQYISQLLSYSVSLCFFLSLFSLSVSPSITPFPCSLSLPPALPQALSLSSPTGSPVPVSHIPGACRCPPLLLHHICCLAMTFLCRQPVWAHLSNDSPSSYSSLSPLTWLCCHTAPAQNRDKMTTQKKKKLCPSSLSMDETWWRWRE